MATPRRPKCAPEFASLGSSPDGEGVSLWLVLGFGSLGVSERGKRSLDHTNRWSEVGNGARPVKRKS